MMYCAITGRHSERGCDVVGTATFLRVLRALLVLAVVALTAALAWPAAAMACSLDGVVSISVNGVLAAQTQESPTAANLLRWAPFTFAQTYASGDLLRLTEDRDLLRQTLPTAALAQPFRWSWGDGVSATAVSATHRYVRRGWYMVKVYAFWPSRHGWILFDSARLNIVPSRPQAPSAMPRATSGASLDGMAGRPLLYSGTIALGVLLACAAYLHRRSGRRSMET
ncbi:MAG: hypothetical protein JWO42_1546 [Chloroflexi bacterium]|nr:hypothetical protein [Chloroflexota bacterium]